MFAKMRPIECQVDKLLIVKLLGRHRLGSRSILIQPLSECGSRKPQNFLWGLVAGMGQFGHHWAEHSSFGQLERSIWPKMAY
jgi:hypothetical protein